jgi:hypothetical protein
MSDHYSVPAGGAAAVAVLLLFCWQAHLCGDAHVRLTCSPVAAVTGSRLRAAARLAEVALLMLIRQAAARLSRGLKIEA